ncbi:MurR/RpiR family transcriptional regulator [Psychromonas aquimarina]|uniref:MurR/RpiR family transcriptional regulator n=1 Tax=Psychromonas aquimarina TaxID=444919 RepID=UPI00040DCE82|nr:MurR/RpiR family transcriptional regulator [Psychromonas aquimarina]
MNTFKGTERHIYEFIISHASDLTDISAKQVAAKSLTTTTSVNRVCKKMGYSSYTELRYKLAGDLINETQRQVEPLTAQEGSEEKIIKTAQALKSAQVVYLYSRGASLVSVNYLSRFLSLANIPHLVITDIHQLSSANKGTLLVISKSGETDAVIDMTHNAKRKEMTVISVSHQNSTLSKISRLNIDLTRQIDGTSVYGRESQIDILEIVDQIGEHILRR